MIYLASPYSSGIPLGADRDYAMQRRYEDTRSFVAEHVKTSDRCIFSPIVYYHEMAKHHDLPKDSLYWEKLNHIWQCKSDVFWVLRLDGWRESLGVTKEIEFARENNMPIRFVDPNTPPIPWKPDSPAVHEVDDHQRRQDLIATIVAGMLSEIVDSILRAR